MNKSLETILSNQTNNSAINFYQALQQQARIFPDAIAYRFVRNDDAGDSAISYRELLAKVDALMLKVRDQYGQGDRVVIAMPSCLEFVVAFLACQGMGVISVPVPQPTGNRRDARLENILLDAAPVAVFTLASIAQSLISSGTSGLSTMPLVAIDQIDDLTDESTAPAVDGAPEAIAFLQYTSGSTGDPKGVCVSNANLMANCEHMHKALVPDGDNLGVLWLPLFHDMGLIGGMLLPLYSGFPVVIMQPASFLMKPSRWLRLVSDYQATITVAPNFALELCSERITDEQLLELDLSSLRVLLIGAEPVQAAVLERFERKFSATGFRSAALCPVYGLAEATLLVSGELRQEPFVAKTFSRDSIGQVGARAIASQSGTQSVESVGSAGSVESVRLVGCGPLVQSTLIVDPEARTALPDGHLGEIWVCGEAVAAGYWRRPEKTQITFGNQLQDPSAQSKQADCFLRTGDLGFIDQGQLYVTGRIKDLIIVRGKNVYPQDIERLASTADPALSVGLAAAFSTELEGQETVAVVVEVTRHALRKLKDGQDADRVVRAIDQAILQEIGISVDAIDLLRPNQLRRTSSGKVRRHANCVSFVNSDFEFAFRWKRKDSTAQIAEPDLPKLQTAEQYEEWIVTVLSERCSLDPRDVSLDQPFVNFGLDSLAAVEFVQALQDRAASQVTLDPTTLWDYPTISSLVAYLCDERESEDSSGHSDQTAADIALEIKKLEALL